MGLAGAVSEDAEAEYIRNITEDHLVTGIDIKCQGNFMTEPAGKCGHRFKPYLRLKCFHHSVYYFWKLCGVYRL